MNKLGETDPGGLGTLIICVEILTITPFSWILAC